ncbi:hypothetical protein, partial [Cupriavidus sp. SK-3]|uniref:hypothetical protein n=1 Tax=Cupriavidus sp. SK-3 TaxID=1470558 RepID=UPI001F1EEFBA
PERHSPLGAPDYHVQLTGHLAGVHFFLSFSDANRSALSMEAMRPDCPLCEHAGVRLACRCAAIHPVHRPDASTRSPGLLSSRSWLLPWWVIPVAPFWYR